MYKIFDEIKSIFETKIILQVFYWKGNELNIIIGLFYIKLPHLDLYFLKFLTIYNFILTL